MSEKSIGQRVHDEIAKREGWARKWSDMSERQQSGWNEGAAAALTEISAMKSTGREEPSRMERVLIDGEEGP